MTIGAGWYLVHEIFVALVRVTEEAGEAHSGDPQSQKMGYFIPEFLLDKEAVLMNWEGGPEDRGTQGACGTGSLGASCQRH